MTDHRHIESIHSLKKQGLERFIELSDTDCPIAKNALWLAENSPKNISCLWSVNYIAYVRMCVNFKKPILLTIDRHHAAAMLKDLMRNGEVSEKLII